MKKEYAKIKAREPVTSKPYPFDTEAAESTNDATSTPAEASQELHPDRQAMLDEPRAATPPPTSARQPFVPHKDRAEAREARRKAKPAPFQKELSYAEKQREEAEARRAEFERRDTERKDKIAERERFRRAMAKARTGGKGGQRKLGRESAVLLEKVRRMVAE